MRERRKGEGGEEKREGEGYKSLNWKNATIHT